MSTQGAWHASTTYKPVFISWVCVTAVFLSSHLNIDFIASDPIGVGTYAAAVAALWAVWLSREFKEVYRERGSDVREG